MKQLQKMEQLKNKRWAFILFIILMLNLYDLIIPIYYPENEGNMLFKFNPKFFYFDKLVILPIALVLITYFYIDSKHSNKVKGILIFCLMYFILLAIINNL